jgi:hypothetical protein
MKALNWIAWSSLGAGVLIIILAAISLLIGRNIFGFNHLANYFTAANSFLLVAIALLIVTNRCKCNEGSKEQ